MPLISVNGVRLHYLDDGAGEPVVMVMGTGGGARAWHLHQVPALTAAGYRTITLDNRGIRPSDECASGFGVDDLAGDVAGLIESLDAGPCRLVGTSMGAYVVQELALARPELVSRAVLMATRGRSDELRSALARAEAELYDSGETLPPSYGAVVRAMQNLSPRTLDDRQAVRDWLDVFEATPPAGPGIRAQLGLEPIPDRLAAYRAIGVPCHVIAFADDLLTPPHLGRELAATIPDATFELIENCGHYGYLEDPAAVNKSIIEFLRKPI